MHTVVPRWHVGGLICCFLSVFCSEAFERVVLCCIYIGHERVLSLVPFSSSNDLLLGEMRARRLQHWMHSTIVALANVQIMIWLVYLDSTPLSCS